MMHKVTITLENRTIIYTTNRSANEITIDVYTKYPDFIGFKIEKVDEIKPKQMGSNNE